MNNLTNRQLVLAFISASKGVTVSEVSKSLGIERSSVSGFTSRLLSSNEIERRGQKAIASGGRAVVFCKPKANPAMIIGSKKPSSHVRSNQKRLAGYFNEGGTPLSKEAVGVMLHLSSKNLDDLCRGAQSTRGSWLMTTENGLITNMQPKTETRAVLVEKARAALLDDSNRSNIAIAAAIGVSNMLVGKVRQEMVKAGEPVQEKATHYKTQKESDGVGMKSHAPIVITRDWEDEKPHMAVARRIQQLWPVRARA